MSPAKGREAVGFTTQPRKSAVQAQPRESTGAYGAYGTHHGNVEASPGTSPVTQPPPQWPGSLWEHEREGHAAELDPTQLKETDGDQEGGTQGCTQAAGAMMQREDTGKRVPTVTSPRGALRSRLATTEHRS